MKPTPIREAWLEYSQGQMQVEQTGDRERDLKRAYFAGASALFFLAASFPDGEEEERVDVIDDELDRFACDVEDGVD